MQNIDSLWTLRQVSEYLNISYSALRKDWRARLMPHGVNPFNVGANGRKVLRFNSDEIRKAVEKMRIIEKPIRRQK